MNHPTPAIVSQGAAQRLPRLALLLFCVAYVLPGFIGREPWKSADMTAFGYMMEMLADRSDWWTPQLMGWPPEVDALLPYWLGVWAMQAAPAWVAPDLAVRLPFVFLLVLSLLTTWYASYYLARSPTAQPVAFAFGGEATPRDYARAMADGGLLAFIACLGLAQMSHETTPALAQLSCTALTFYGLSALPYRAALASIATACGLLGLALSGAPTLALLFGLGGVLTYALDRPGQDDLQDDEDRPRSFVPHAMGLILLSLALAACSSYLQLWRWRIEFPESSWSEWRSLGQLLLWFTWPAWPLALWTLWRWRYQLFRRHGPSRHLSLPLWFVLVTVITTLSTSSADRSLLLALPAMAALAAFALPTLSRSVSALVDWFTLLFFCGCAVVVWVVWIAMQTGVPAQPAANVARLAPGFVHSFTWLPFSLALMATLAWTWLVTWRVGRHRTAIWKSLVLPAGGAALCWLLIMTLWLPLLDYARSYVPLVRPVALRVQGAACVESLGLNAAQAAAFQFHGEINLKPLNTGNTCPWLIVAKDRLSLLAGSVDARQWQQHSEARHPADGGEAVVLYQRMK